MHRLIITHSETAQKGEVQLSAYAYVLQWTCDGRCTLFHNRALQHREFLSCVDSQTAATEPMINALLWLWQHAETITCSMFPLGLTLPTHLIPHLGRIHQQFIETNMDLVCCLCARFQSLTRSLSAQTSSTSLGRRILCSSCCIYLPFILCNDSRLAKKTLITRFHTVSFR